MRAVVEIDVSCDILVHYKNLLHFNEQAINLMYISVFLLLVNDLKKNIFFLILLQIELFYFNHTIMNIFVWLVAI